MAIIVILHNLAFNVYRPQMKALRGCLTGKVFNGIVIHLGRYVSL